MFPPLPELLLLYTLELWVLFQRCCNVEGNTLLGLLQQILLTILTVIP